MDNSNKSRPAAWRKEYGAYLLSAASNKQWEDCQHP